MTDWLMNREVDRLIGAHEESRRRHAVLTLMLRSESEALPRQDVEALAHRAIELDRRAQSRRLGMLLFLHCFCMFIYMRVSVLVLFTACVSGYVYTTCV
jgi:hypothetical protein